MSRVIEIKVIHHNRWEILLCESKGFKFVVAKKETIYGETIKVKLYKMYDGTIIACAEKSKLVDTEELSALRKVMIAMQNMYC